MVQCERLLNYGAIRAAGFPPGAFSWTQTYSNPGVITHLSICVPLPTTGWDPGERLRVLRVYRTGEARPEAETAWEWDGNLDKPTINPSIGVTLNRVDDRSNRVDEGYAFHGWLKGGVPGVRVMVSDLIETHLMETLVQSGLPDQALDIYIDAADNRIVTEVGPHDGELAQFEDFPNGGYSAGGISLPASLYSNSLHSNVYLYRPAVSIAEVKVWEYGLSEADGSVLDEAQYRVDHGGRVLVRVDAWWETHVKVTFTPVAENPKRRQALVQLVKLALAFDGYKTESIGSTSRTTVNYVTEERRILNTLRHKYAGASLLA